MLRLNLISVLKQFESDVPVIVNIQEEYIQAEVVEEPDIEDIGYIEAIEITLKESIVLQEIYVRMTNHIDMLSKN